MTIPHREADGAQIGRGTHGTKRARGKIVYVIWKAKPAPALASQGTVERAEIGNFDYDPSVIAEGAATFSQEFPRMNFMFQK